MIRLFKNTETDFTHNGVQVLDDIVIGDSCILLNGINEVFSLEMEVAIFDNDKWRDIETEMFLKIQTGDSEQIFRIKEIVQGFSTMKIYGKHVFFDLENNFILDTNVVQKDGRSAIAQILGGMSNNMVNTYYGTSDIDIINNLRLVRKNVVTALIGDGDNSFLNRWGGELEVNNFNFAINKRIGQDKGFQIRYGKNCTGYEGNISTYGLCTRIVPIGFDGIMLEDIKWVDSPNITKYPQIYTQEVKFEDIKVKENPEDEEGYNTIEEARVALAEVALEYFNITKCDIPCFNAVVNFTTLENTIEYEDMRTLENVNLGDDVSIYLSNINVTATSRVIRTKYNFFTRKFIEIELGEVKPNVFKQLVTLKEQIDLVTEQLGGNTWQDIINKSLDEATKLMEEGLKGSYVIAMKNQIVIGDAPEINNMVNCIVMNKNGIGFSNNGYLPEQLVSAMTIDGKINASCITVGELNAALIKAGVIMSKSGKVALSIEDDYFEVTHTESTTKTRLDAEGMYILDENGETIASLANKESWTELKADRVYATNVENIYIGDANLYVDHNSENEVRDGSIDYPFTSFYQLKDYLEKMPIIHKNLYINIVTEGAVDEQFYLNGIRGRGDIRISFSKNFIIKTTASYGVVLRNITNKLIVTGNRSNWDSTDGFMIKCTNGVNIINCTSFNISSLLTDTTSYGVYIESSNGRIMNVDYGRTYSALAVQNGLVWQEGTCRGSNTNAIRSFQGAYVLVGETNYNSIRQKGVYDRISGDIKDLTTLVSEDTTLYVPVIPPTIDTIKDFSSTGMGTYQYLWKNWASGDWGNRAIQGEYLSFGNKAGHVFFEVSAIRSFIGSGTVQSATITIKRRNGGGNSAATSLYINSSSVSDASGTPTYSNNTYLGQLAWNQEETFTLPTSIVNAIKTGTANSIAFYSSTYTSAYTEIVSCKINIKVNK